MRTRSSCFLSEQLVMERYLVLVFSERIHYRSIPFQKQQSVVLRRRSQYSLSHTWSILFLKGPFPYPKVFLYFQFLKVGWIYMYPSYFVGTRADWTCFIMVIKSKTGLPVAA